MRNSAQYLMFLVIVLVLGGALEELLPKFCGVGFPILLAAVHSVAARRTAPAAILFALAAGGMMDALSALTPMTSAGFCLVVVLIMRWLPVPRLAPVATYPLYQAWLAIWTTGIGSAVFVRILVAVPLGLATAVATHALLVWCERRGAVDEAE